jgi:hypothetical protein
MNDTPLFTAEQIDELLSAELDGEFDAAARDLGLEPTDARDRLAAQVPGLGARRAALGAAREVLAEVPAVDELVLARLRAKAVKAATAAHEVGQKSRTHRLRRLSAIAGGLAASIALIAGLALTAQHNNGSTSKSVAAPDEKARATTPKAAGAAATGGENVVDLGAAADVPALVERLRAQVPRGFLREGAAAPKRPDGSSDSAVAGTNTACERVADQVSGAGNPALRGVATLTGAPVEVYLFHKGADDIVVVLRTDCRLVTRQTLPGPSG